AGVSCSGNFRADSPPASKNGLDPIVSRSSHAMSRTPHPLPMLLAAVLLTASSMAMAQQAPPPQQRDRGDREQTREFQPPPQRERGSLSDAVRRAERNTRGEVL